MARPAVASLIVTCFPLLFASPGAAQASANDAPGIGTWSLDLRIGYAAPTGDLGDVSDEGILGGLGIAYRVGDRLALRSDVTMENLERGGQPRVLGGVRGPETDVWNIVAGMDLELTEASHTPWSVSTYLLGGISYFDVSGSLDGGASVPAQTDWKPTTAVALVVGYAFHPRVEVFARSVIFAMLGDRTSDGEFLGKEVTVETAIGSRLSF
jgi:hypothetical protein